MSGTTEKEMYFKEFGWNWHVIDPNPPSKPKVAKRKLFRNEDDQFFRSKITVEAGVNIDDSQRPYVIRRFSA